MRVLVVLGPLRIDITLNHPGGDDSGDDDGFELVPRVADLSTGHEAAFGFVGWQPDRPAAEDHRP